MAQFIFRESFDTYNGANAPIGYLSRWARDGGNAPTLVAGRFLGKSLQNEWVNRFIRAFDTPDSSFACGFSFQQENNPTGVVGDTFINFRDASLTVQFGLRWSLGGALQVVRASDGGAVIAASEAGIMQNGVWNFIEIEVVLGNANNGQIRVYMNGDPDPVIDATGVNTANNTNPVAFIGLFSNAIGSHGGAGSTKFDDMYVWDEPERRGPIRIEALPVDGNGAHQDFLPSTGSSNAACIDEIVPDTADYVIGTTPGQYDQYTMANLSSSVADVFEVNLVMLGQQTGSTIRAVALGVEVDGDTSLGGDIYMGSGFARYERRMLQTPQEVPQPWTKELVDGLILRPQITV